MLMKILGATALIVSSGLYGIYCGRRIEKSVEQTKDLRSGLNALKQEIYFNGVPLGKALENAAELMSTEVKDVFSECGKGIDMQNGTSLKEHLLPCITESKIFIDEQCKSILSRWAANAGRGDRNAELESLEYTLSLLDQFIENAEERCERQARMCKNCGFLIGAFIVAVLI